MNGDYVTIDTNIFEHLFNLDINGDEHIDKVLAYLVAKKVVLCADAGGRIFAEYRHRLRPIWATKSDQGQRLNWLRYFLVLAPPHQISVEFESKLMTLLKTAMKKAEVSDRIFVYVAILSDTVMVSNDHNHITGNRTKLRKCARSHSSDETDFIDSKRAHADWCTDGEAENV